MYIWGRSEVGLKRQYFKQRFEVEAEKKRDALENAPRTETVVTPLHGLHLGQAWVKKLKYQKPCMLHKIIGTYMHFKQLTHLYFYVFFLIFNVCSFQ